MRRREIERVTRRREMLPSGSIDAEDQRAAADDVRAPRWRIRLRVVHAHHRHGAVDVEVDAVQRQRGNQALEQPAFTDHRTRARRRRPAARGRHEGQPLDITRSASYRASRSAPRRTVEVGWHRWVRENVLDSMCIQPIAIRPRSTRCRSQLALPRVRALLDRDDRIGHDRGDRDDGAPTGKQDRSEHADRERGPRSASRLDDPDQKDGGRCPPRRAS